jgi:hypothetical protein
MKIKPRPDVKKRWWFTPLIEIIKIIFSKKIK